MLYNSVMPFLYIIILAVVQGLTELPPVSSSAHVNNEYRLRVILLAARELDPFHFCDRTKLEYENIKEYASTQEHLASNTAEVYFRQAARANTAYLSRSVRL
jgi:hypothetical protein